MEVLTAGRGGHVGHGMMTARFCVVDLCSLVMQGERTHKGRLQKW